MKPLIEAFYRTIATLSFLAISILPVRSADGKFDHEKLDSRITSLIKKYNIPDAEIAIIRSDSVIFKFIKNPSNENKNYMIGSCSKSFTALSIMILAENRKIDIDKPVKSYLPWFTLKDTKYIDSITVRHLLNHTSGIGSRYGFFDYPVNDFETYKGKLTGHLKKVMLENEPGKAFQYSNLNYLLLGFVSEAVTNEKYPDFLSENIFAKVGMNSSYAGFSDEILSWNIKPYQYNIFNIPSGSKVYSHSDYSLAYGYVSSNSTDLCKYLNFMIHKGITYRNDTLINSDSYNSLITPGRGNYAMGWIKVNYNNIDMLIHSGLDESYSSVLAVCPDEGLGIVVLCNVNNLEFCSLVESSIIDMLADKPFFNPFSIELMLRWIPESIVILTLILLLFNLYRWNKYSFKMGLIIKLLPILRLITGIFLSIAGILLIRKVYHVSVFSASDFQPDIVFSFLFILILGIISSFIRYFGTYSKKTLFKRPQPPAPSRV